MKNKLKIGILVDQLVAGGVQKSAIQEAKELKKMGHQVAIFVLVKLGHQYQYHDLTRGLKVIFLSDYNPRMFRQAIHIPYFAFLTHLHLINPFFAHRYKILKGYDFIISHGTTTCITAKAISRKLKIPYLAFIWDPMTFILEKVYSPTPLRFLFPILKPLTHYYERSFLTSAAIVATSSKVHQQYIQNNYHIKPKIIHPGSFPSKTIPKKTDSYILGYSRWELAKNPELFLWLAKKLPKAKFLIAGSWTNPQEKAWFKNKIKKLKLHKQIKLLSPLIEKDLKKIASQSLVWLHPNFEAFGLAGLEMASMGLPIMIPQGSGVTEIFKNTQHGFFFSLKKKSQILKYLNNLINSPLKARKMGTQAAKTAKLYTWKYHAQHVINDITTYTSQTKVIFLANAFVSTRSIGGGDRFLIELAHLLPKTIHSTIILPTTGLYHWQRAGIDQDNVRYMVLKPTRFDNIDLPIPLFLAYLIRTIQTIFLLNQLPSFQVIHTSTDLIPDTIPAFILKQKQPTIPWAARFFHFIEHPLKRKGRLWVNIGSYILQRLSVKLLKRANIIMTDNLIVQKELVEKGINSQQLKLHIGGVDTKNISSTKPQRSLQSTALFVGRLQAHKGVFDLINIWAKVVKPFPKAKLFVIGHSTEQIVKKIKNKIRKSNLEKNIILTGYIDQREKLMTYLKSTKLLLFLDYEAGFGLIVSEALAAGIPVIAYDLPIFGSIYKQGFVTVPLGNTQKSANKVIELLKNKTLYKKLQLQTLAQAKNLDWSYASKSFNKLMINLSSYKNK